MIDRRARNAPIPVKNRPVITIPAVGEGDLDEFPLKVATTANGTDKWHSRAPMMYGFDYKSRGREGRGKDIVVTSESKGGRVAPRVNTQDQAFLV
jgi:hypothetical protein